MFSGRNGVLLDALSIWTTISATRTSTAVQPQHAEIVQFLEIASMRALACDSTVCMDGMIKPCATPTSTRAAMMPRVLAALRGVSRLPADHSAKDAMSVTRPPYFCAAQPPGTCGQATMG